MKLAILGDTHFGMRGDSLQFHKYYEKFYNDVFFPYLKENQIGEIIQLGDLFDRRKFINFNSLFLCKKYFFDKLRDEKLNFYTLLGNHDVAYKNTLEVNSTSLLLKEYDNIIIFNKPHSLNFDGTFIDFVPWICTDNEQEIIEFMKSSKSHLCFGHFEINGFEMERNVVCQTGVDKNIFDKYDMVLSGHFHHKSNDGHIYYVGTPGEIMWSDYDDPRGFHIFDTKTRELEFIRNPYKMFHKINYNDTEQDSDFWRSYDYEKLKESYVKVIVINKQNPYLFDGLIDNLYRIGVSDLSIVEDYNDLEVQVDEDIVNQAEDTVTILSKYIDNLTLQVEPEKLKLLMRELYLEALNTEITE